MDGELDTPARRTLVALVAFAALLCVALAAGGTAPASSPAAAAGAGGVELRRLGGEFTSPVFVSDAPGRANRKLLFVVEQGGAVKVVRRGRQLARPFLDIGSAISTGGERGLLSIAFDPGYAKNRRFYLYFTGPEGEIVVAQGRRSKRRKTVARPGLRPVIEIPHADAGNHNGGTAAFGPDGNLWIGTGDGGSSCDPPENAQNPDSLLGKLLRIAPGRKGGYRVPQDNPFVGKPGRDEIYALGLRNPFRFSFDRGPAAIAIGDVGQNGFEEVDIERLDSLAGANFGWDAFEGSTLTVRDFGTCAAEEPTPPPADHELPVHTYAHDGAGHSGCSITGGLVVRDRRLPSLLGRYVFADFCTGQLRSLQPAFSGDVDERSEAIGLGSPTSFATGRGGRVYVTSISGELYRLAPSRPRSGPRSPDADRARRRAPYRAEQVARFDQPVHVTGPEGANGLIFVVEQPGVIRLIKDGRKLSGSFLDIRDRVQAGGERGLLSVAFAPGYARNHRFYVFFTDRRGDLRVEEYRRAANDPRDARERSARTVIEVEHSRNANHNGGQLQFGPDGLLYISTGDGGGAGDPPENAQDKDSLLGKILRIDPRRRGKRDYSVPAGNPFVGRPGADEVFAYGLRNPYRFSFDRSRRRIAIGDVGQDAREEIDLETIGAARGANFGWDAFEGRRRFRSPDASPPPANHTEPIHDYGHGGGNCAVTGGFVVRDRRIRALFGRYIYGDFCGGQIRTLKPTAKGAPNDRPAGLARQSGLSSFGEDSGGRIWFTNVLSGKVFRLRPK